MAMRKKSAEASAHSVTWHWNLNLPEPAALRDAMREAAQSLFACMGLQGRVAVDITMLDETEIREANCAFRQMDAVTDVLSFPMIAFPHPAGQGENLTRYRHAVDAQTHCVFLGDILVCYQRLLAQAEEYGHSPQREGGFLTVHGLLHLLGHDHQTPEQTAAMRVWEARALAGCGLCREG